MECEARTEGEPFSETDAIAALQMGDMRGLDTLVSHHLARARRVASAITLDRHVSEDVAHVAFIKAVNAIAGFDAARAFWPWFRQIVVNEALRVLRSRQRFIDDIDLEGLPAHDGRPDPGDPAVQLEARELRRLLQQALMGLDRRDRAVLVLHYFEDQPLEAVAVELDWPVGTVKARLSRARRRLRERIERGPLALVIEMPSGRPRAYIATGSIRGTGSRPGMEEAPPMPN